jgi:Ca2+-binding EF-hand superfamily protein
VIGREIPDSDDAVWDEMIKEIDTDQTGIINFNDFVKMMNGDGNPLHKKS